MPLKAPRGPWRHLNVSECPKRSLKTIWVPWMPGSDRATCPGPARPGSRQFFRGPARPGPGKNFSPGPGTFNSIWKETTYHIKMRCWLFRKISIGIILLGRPVMIFVSCFMRQWFKIEQNRYHHRFSHSILDRNMMAGIGVWLFPVPNRSLSIPYSCPHFIWSIVIFHAFVLKLLYLLLSVPEWFFVASGLFFRQLSFV